MAGLLLNAVAESCGAGARVEMPLIENEHVSVLRVDAPLDEQELLAGQISAAPRGSAQRDKRPQVLFPGAFNPLHVGHKKMAELARGLLGLEVAFEISTENVDKPPLDFIETEQRLRQFTSGEEVWLTRAPTFVKKSELFPRCTFIVGVDTIERVGQERYYGSEAEMRDALEAIAARNCRFLVFGRTVNGVYRTLDDLNLPKQLAAVCRGVPGATFREDISSTELRENLRGPT